MKSLKLVLALASLLLACFPHARAVQLTPEQQARLNALPPDLREKAMEELRKFDASQSGRAPSGPLDDPLLVVPRPMEADTFDTSRYGEPAQPRDALGADKQDDDAETDDFEQNLRPFGYALFAGMPTTFAPATDIPIPSDYVVGPGDQIRVQFFGKQSANYDLYVSRDGVLQVPELGPISVAGQSFSELKSDIARRVSDQMMGVQAFVSMGELRSIRVFALGDVRRPGSYTVSSLSTLTNALFVSGGIRKIGSLRQVQLKRAGETVAELDLYDLLLRGDTSADARLQPGDVIFVPPAGRLVGVAGEVRRPAIYEMKGGESARDLIEMAGGLTEQAHASLSQIERISASGMKEILDIDLSRDAAVEAPVRGGDTIRVRSALDRVENYVSVLGAVERPGDYQWQEGMRVSDILTSTDQLLPDADLNYALVVSKNRADGRLFTRSFSFAGLFAGNQPRQDLPLSPEDRIIVFDDTAVERLELEPIIERMRAQGTSGEPQRVVEVTGRVRHPGSYPLDQGMRVSDLVRAAGGFNEDAYTLEAELVRFVDNSKEQRESLLLPIDLKSMRENPRMDLELQPFDQLLIKQVPAWNEAETITIQGEVRFPGIYVIERGENLARIVERAGGLTELADPNAAVFLRESLRKAEQEQMMKLQARLREDIAALKLQEGSPAGDSLATAESLLGQLETVEAAGRLVIDLARILEDGPYASSLRIRGGDELLVPQQPQAVTIIGSVNYPTSHLHRKGLNRDDYIALSGGTLKTADKRRIYVVRANGQVEAGSHSRFFPKSNLVINPGDTIVVPVDVDRMRPLKYWAEVSQIIYQVAVGVAAVNSF